MMVSVWHIKISGLGGYGKNDTNGHIRIDETNIDGVNLLEMNNQLNLYNWALPKNHDAAQEVISEALTQTGEGTAQGQDINAYNLNLASTNSALWPVADSGFEQNLYYTCAATMVTYKVPLQLFLDRFMPKASLLLSWYLVKDNDYADDI